MKRSIIKPERNNLFLLSKNGILALLVCVTMAAAMLLPIYLVCGNNKFSASEDTGGGMKSTSAILKQRACR